MKQTILLIAALVFAVGLFAQVPQGMSYQTVIRDANGHLVISQTVGMRISIIDNGNSTTVYQEKQTVGTNTNGLASVQVGMGTPVIGAFAAINWSSGNYNIQTETDPTGGTNYTITGVSQLLSVPYAFYAGRADTSSVPLNLIAGSGIHISNDTIYNTFSSPPVTITAGPGVTVSGTYPNFTVTAKDTAPQIISYDSLNGTVNLTNGGSFVNPTAMSVSISTATPVAGTARNTVVASGLRLTAPATGSYFIAATGWLSGLQSPDDQSAALNIQNVTQSSFLFSSYLGVPFANGNTVNVPAVTMANLNAGDIIEMYFYITGTGTSTYHMLSDGISGQSNLTLLRIR